MIQASRRVLIVVAEQPAAATFAYAAPRTTNLHERVEHDTVRHARAEAAQRMLIDHGRDQKVKLFPDRFIER